MHFPRLALLIALVAVHPVAAGKPHAPVQDAMTAPELIAESRVEPRYPEAARLVRTQGQVILQALVTREGAVEKPKIVRSPTPELGQAAIEAVRQWRYRPATFQGRPVAVYVTVTVDFALTERPKSGG